jgi:hypothetical protein
MVQTAPPVTVASGPQVNDPASPARRYKARACAARPRQSASGRCRPPTALPWPPSLLHADAAPEPPSPSPAARRADKSHCPPLRPLFTLSPVCVPPRAQPSPPPILLPPVQSDCRRRRHPTENRGCRRRYFPPLVSSAAPFIRLFLNPPPDSLPGAPGRRHH